MARTPIRNLRVDDETWGRWDAEAARRGVSTSEFVRVTMDAECGVEPSHEPRAVAPQRRRGDLGSADVSPRFKGGAR